MKENLTIDVVLSDDMKVDQIKKLQNALSTAAYVKSVHYVSKEEAAELLTKDLGQDPEELLGFNPLPSLLEVKLKSEYATVDSIRKIEKEIQRMSTNIREIQYRKELMQTVNENMRYIGLLLLGLVVLLLLISYVLISNTIRLMIYSKRFLIHTMKLVGATNRFIIAPFVRSTVFSGIIAACISALLILWLIYYISGDTVNFIELMGWNTLAIVFLSVLVFGVVISMIATWLAVKKYLRMREDDLYYI
ncbi:MAG: permease-like cell division protein FtsX [Dysgonamonadaceae bacterium]|nr:permease-like cell division protein FtsX [Dysgonamonadaceae bacterium]